MKTWFYREFEWFYSFKIINKHFWDKIKKIDHSLYEIDFIKLKSVNFYTVLGIWRSKKKDDYTFFYWSWSWISEIEAIDTAVREVCMNYENIWLFKLKNIKKEEILSSSDHYIYYLNKKNREEISFLFDRSREKEIFSLQKSEKIFSFKCFIKKLNFNIYCFDLSPHFLYKEWINVVKVFSPELQSIDFWFCSLKLNKCLNFGKVKKESIINPHPFF